MTEKIDTAIAAGTADHPNTDTAALGDAKIRAAAPPPGPPIPATGMLAVYGACSDVDLDKLPAGVGLSIQELDLLRALLVDEIAELVDLFKRVAQNRMSVPQDERLARAIQNDMGQLDDLMRTLRVIGLVRLQTKGWDVIVDRAAMVRCAAVVGNAWEDATYNDHAVMAHRVHPLAVRFGITDEPRPRPRNPMDVA